MEKPTIESLNVDEIKEQIDAISPQTTREELLEKMDFFVRQLNISYEQNRRNTLVLMEALEQSQSKYKFLEAKKTNWKQAIKKILIGLGWYEASLDELKEIHFGK